MPRFRLRNVPSDCEVALHETTSDAFFNWLADDFSFDIILIDGLHTFEQTWQDFVNSLKFVNPLRYPVWIIDDVVPEDEMQAIPSYREAKRAQKLARRRPGLWRGDVWKVLLMLQATEGLEFSVFETQAVVWLSSTATKVRLPTPEEFKVTQSQTWDGEALARKMSSRTESWDAALARYVAARARP